VVALLVLPSIERPAPQRERAPEFEAAAALD
jgi:hypothetical protein